MKRLPVDVHTSAPMRFHELHPARTATLIPLDMRSGKTIFRNLIEEGRYA
jgi:hypothetical protein